MKEEQMTRVLSEVSHYLKGCDDDALNRLPKKLMNFIENNKSKDYECNFDYRKRLSELDIMPETKSFIALICISYWCNEEEKSILLKQLNQNDIDYQKELSAKYTDMFAKPEDNKPQNKVVEKEAETKEIVKYNEEKWYQVIFSKIKKILFFWKKN